MFFFLLRLFDNITALWEWLVHGYWELYSSTDITIIVMHSHTHIRFHNTVNLFFRPVTNLLDKLHFLNTVNLFFRPTTNSLDKLHFLNTANLFFRPMTNSLDKLLSLDSARNGMLYITAPTPIPKMLEVQETTCMYLSRGTILFHKPWQLVHLVTKDKRLSKPDPAQPQNFWGRINTHWLHVVPVTRGRHGHCPVTLLQTNEREPPMLHMQSAHRYIILPFHPCYIRSAWALSNHPVAD